MIAPVSITSMASMTNVMAVCALVEKKNTLYGCKIKF
jgi:hypothetical protein